MTKDKLKESEINKWVILCTDENKKGVFYGKLKEFNRKKDYAVLAPARMIVYWPKKTKGVLGLASKGALKGSKVSSFVPEIKLMGISAIIETTQEAQETFKQKEIWD